MTAVPLPYGVAARGRFASKRAAVMVRVPFTPRAARSMTCIPLVGPESKAIRRATFWAPVKPVTELPDSARDNQADRRPSACKEFRICCSCDPLQKLPRNRLGFNDLKTELGGAFLE